MTDNEKLKKIIAGLEETVDDLAAWERVVYSGDRGQITAMKGRVLDALELLKTHEFCDDCVSRKDAMQAARHAWAKGLEPSQYIEIMPSAAEKLSEPKTVVYDMNYYLGERVPKCPKCRAPLDRTFDYCPSCGQAVKWNA